MISIRDMQTLDRMFSGLDGRFSISPFFRLYNQLHLPIKIYQCYFPELAGNNRIPGAGSVNTNVVQAVIAGIGERYERYSLTRDFPVSEKRKFSLLDKPSDLNCLTHQDLIDLQGLHSFQYLLPQADYVPISESAELNWIKGHRLIDQSDIWVPEVSVLLQRNKQNYFAVTTNGCALSSTTEQATVSAACELIERDNVLMFWWRKEEPIFVDFKEHLKIHFPDLMTAFGPWMRYVHLIYKPGPTGIPTFISIFSSKNDQGHPSFVMTAATHLNPLQAARKSLLELATMINHKLVWFFKNKDIPQFDPNFDLTFNSFEDHHFYYMFEEYAKHIYFKDQIGKPPQIRLADIPSLDTNNVLANLEAVRCGFRRGGFNPIVIDQTSQDVERLGFKVMRVMDPQIVDLNSQHVARRWGKKRLFDHKIRSITDLNQFPHPFP